jgi:hypothetical protein
MPNQHLERLGYLLTLDRKLIPLSPKVGLLITLIDEKRLDENPQMDMKVSENSIILSWSKRSSFVEVFITNKGYRVSAYHIEETGKQRFLLAKDLTLVDEVIGLLFEVLG